MGQLQLRLLGAFELRRGDGQQVQFATKKAKALLAYLAVHCGEPQQRAKLAALFWEESSGEQARESLRQTLTLLRKALSPEASECLLVHSDTVALAPAACSIDIHEFAELAGSSEINDLARAALLYRGEYLEGFHLREAEFERWLSAVRQGLNEKAVNALDKLLSNRIASGILEGGITIATRLLSLDPLRESAHRGLMQLYCKQGRYASALQQYQNYADQLAKELGVEPDAETKALYRQIREQRSRPPSPKAENALQKTAPGNKNDISIFSQELERRQITILACDLIGLDAQLAPTDPENVQSLMRAFRPQFAEVIADFGGMTAKFSGSGFLAYFGYPQAHEHDAEQAIRSALHLLKKAPQFSSSLPSNMRARVGIATGPVVVGDFADEIAGPAHSLVGDAPKHAVLLQSIAPADAVLIAEGTRRLVRDLFEYKAIDAAPLKALGIQTGWLVAGERSNKDRFEAFHGAGATKFSGRVAELELLQARWEQAKAGQGWIEFITGEAGIGKSRLVRVFHQEIEPHLWLQYQCSPFHTNSPLHPVARQIGHAAGIDTTDDPEQRLTKLEAVIAGGGSQVHAVAPLFAGLLSIPTGARYPTLELSPAQLRRKTLAALLSHLEDIARKQPVLLLFEDAHWADATSLELFDLLVDRIHRLPILAIVTSRPEFEPSWICLDNVGVMSLSRLDEADILAMVRSIAGEKSLPQDVVEEILRRTDGIPLFVEELARTLLESCVPAEGAGRRGLGAPLSPTSIPATLRDSLMARLDRLGPAKEIAQIGAGIGREFSHALLASVAGKTSAELGSALDRLIAAGLLFREGVPPHATYLFKHALVQDAAYQALLREPRCALHARIAEALESQFAEIAESQPELLAHHCSEAGLIGKAAALWGKAGLQSLTRSALMEAVAQLNRALSQIAALPGTAALRRQQIEFQVALANALMYTKGYASPDTKASFDQARSYIERAEAFGESPEDPLLLFSVLYGFWVGNFVGFNGDALRVLAAQFLALAEKQGTAVPLMIARRLMGTSLMATGNIAESLAHYEKAIVLYDPAEHRPMATRFGQDISVVLLSYRAWTHWLLGHPEAALADSDLALEAAREIGQGATLLYSLAHASLTYLWTGNYAAANTLVEEVIALADEKAAVGWKAFGMMQRGSLLALTGQASNATQIMSSGIGAWRSTGSTLWTPWYLSNLARAYAGLGQFGNAWRCIGEAMTAVETTNERWCEAEVHRTAGEIALMSPEPDAAKAEARFERALAVARGQEAKIWELRAAMSMARLWRDQRKRLKAYDLLTPVYGWFTEGFDTLDLKEAKTLLDELAS
jgi:predicted ATPase/DNA-binding SARP family transcriptional activator